MNIIENNKIIAEFMGWSIQKDPTERFFGRYRHPHGTWYKEVDLAFHHDWNWLMEVVENIERMNYTTSIYHLPKTLNTVKIISGGVDVIGVNRETKIEAVYLAVVEFIKSQN